MGFYYKNDASLTLFLQGFIWKYTCDLWLANTRDRFYCQSAGPDRWISRRTGKLCNEKVLVDLLIFGIFTKFRLENFWTSVRTCGIQAWQVLVSCGWKSVKMNHETGIITLLFRLNVLILSPVWFLHAWPLKHSVCTAMAGPYLGYCYFIFMAPHGVLLACW